MNKMKFIGLVNKNVAENEDITLSKINVEKMIDIVLNSIKDAIYDDGSLTLRGFGSFYVSRQAPRQGRNPKTGETIAVPAKNKLRFKVSPNIIETLNK